MLRVSRVQVEGGCQVLPVLYVRFFWVFFQQVGQRVREHDVEFFFCNLLVGDAFSPNVAAAQLEHYIVRLLAATLLAR